MAKKRREREGSEDDALFPGEPEAPRPSRDSDAPRRRASREPRRSDTPEHTAEPASEDAPERTPARGATAHAGPSPAAPAPGPAPSRRLAPLLALTLVALVAAALTLSHLRTPSRPEPEPLPRHLPAPSTSPPGPLPSLHPLAAPSPTPRASAPPPPAPVPARTPTALERRFPRTLEGTAAVARAFDGEHDPAKRLELLREYALRAGAGWGTDPPLALPEPELAAFFRKALEDPERSIRLEAVSILSNRAFAPGGGILEGALGGATDAETRHAIVGGIAAGEGERAVPLLADLATRDAAPEDRLRDVEALATAGGAAAADALERVATSDAAPEVRARAAGLAKRLRLAPGPLPPR